jgi:hypothetical protein
MSLGILYGHFCGCFGNPQGGEFRRPFLGIFSRPLTPQAPRFPAAQKDSRKRSERPSYPFSLKTVEIIKKWPKQAHKRHFSSFLAPKTLKTAFATISKRKY